MSEDLQARIDELEEENRQLRELLLPPDDEWVPADWKLPPTARRLVNALAARRGRMGTHRLITAVWGFDADRLADAVSSLRVEVSRLRSLIKNRLGINPIERCEYNGGYMLSAEFQALVERLRAEREGRS